MSLLKKIRESHNNLKNLNKFSLDIIRASIESCNCPNNSLCKICKDLLAYYDWRKKERKKHLDNACQWIQHQIMIIFYGPKYKEHNFHFSRDIYTLREIIELYDEYLKEKIECEK